MIGSFPTESALAAMQASAGWSGPLLHSMVAPQLSEAVLESDGRLRHVFQVASTEDVYVKGFFRTIEAIVEASDWGPRDRRAVVIVRPGLHRPESETLVDMFASQYGWRLAELVPFAETDDVEQLALRVVAARPDALHLPIMSEQMLARFLQLLRRHGSHPLIYVNWSPSTPNFLERFGAPIDGLVWATIVGTYADPLSSAFRSRYRQHFQQDPGTGASAIHHDIVKLLATTWSQVRVPWDYAAVADELRNALFRGVAGPIHFGGPGQRALSFPDDSPDPSVAHAHLVFQVQEGRSRLIAPATLATAAFRSPWPQRGSA